MKSLSAIAVVLSAATLSSASFARITDSCAAALDRAALQAIGNTLASGHLSIFGSAIQFRPDLIRVEVNDFGPQSAIYAVDISIDGACKVLSTSVRMETNPSPPR